LQAWSQNAQNFIFPTRPRPTTASHWLL